MADDDTLTSSECALLWHVSQRHAIRLADAHGISMRIGSVRSRLMFRRDVVRIARVREADARARQERALARSNHNRKTL